MIGVALKGLLGRKLRAILTAFAIVLGVAMISGSFVLTDTLGKGFDGIYDESYASTDAVISSKIATSTDEGGEEAPAFSANVLDEVERLARRPRRAGLDRGRDQPHRQGRQAVRRRRASPSASQQTRTRASTRSRSSPATGPAAMDRSRSTSPPPRPRS